jgi:hypothetical protein
MTVTYEMRLQEALQYLQTRYVERDNFLSDSDILDAAERYSIDWHPDASVDCPRPDYDQLVEDLYESLTPKAEESVHEAFRIAMAMFNVVCFMAGGYVEDVS